MDKHTSIKVKQFIIKITPALTIFMVNTITSLFDKVRRELTSI